jgi:hypothetical protein
VKTLLHDYVLLGRLAILPFALLELGIVLWYLTYWDLFPRYSLKRLVPWFISVLSIGGTALGQLRLYLWITSSTRLTDNFVYAVLFVQSIFSGLLIFFVLIKRSAGTRRAPSG